MKISVVIRAYNEAKHLGKLLHGISEQEVRPHEIILVDSGSTDGTVDIARRYGAKIVTIPKAEFTFGRSLNKGIEASEGDIIVIASAHVYPLASDWIKALCAPLGHNGVVLSYGRQCGNALTKFSEKMIFRRWFPSVSTSNQSGYFCNNANCAILKSEWLEFKYDENLTGLEDLAWAKDCQARGGKLAYQADACIVHVHEESWASVRNRYRREAMAFRKINRAYRFGFAKFIYCLVMNFCHDTVSAFGPEFRFSLIKEIFLFRYNQFYGAYLGYSLAVGDDEVAEIFYYPSPNKNTASLSHGQSNVINYDRFDYSDPQR